MNTGSLADCLKQQDGSGDADIQGVESAQHRNTNMSRGGMAPLVGQSGSLRPHDDGSALPHVLVVIETGVLQLGGQYLDVTLLEETDALLGNLQATVGTVKMAPMLLRIRLGL